MRVLVTGGAGFIGSHLAEALCARGVKVTVLDNLSSGSRQNLTATRGEVEFVQGDICDRQLVRKLVGVSDWVFHLAASPSVVYSVENPEQTNRENLEATLALLCECRDARVKRVVFSSSCAVYGDLPRPAQETDPANPLSPYALQKFASDQYVQMFHKFYATPTVALRYFNVFGPRQSFDSPYSGVIARFCDALIKGSRPVIFGNGEQSRDFISVHDVVRANIAAAECETALGKVFNIGTGSSTSVLDLLRLLNQVNRSNVIPEFKAARPGEIMYSRANISSARSILGFEPRISIEEGLRETLLFYRDQFSK